MDAPMEKGNITGLLEAWHHGDPRAQERLMDVVVPELRLLAKHHLMREHSHHTLRTDGLVNEAYVRLHKGKELHFTDRKHFFGIASNAMRQILVDHARILAAEKRGGRCERIHLDDLDALTPDSEIDLLRLDDALTDLAAFDEFKARLVEMRYFGGLTIDEVAELFNVSRASIKRDWKVAKSWLMRRLRGPA